MFKSSKTTPRESARGRQTGRTQEIQRLIGRSLRSVMDLKALGERTIIIDCDVIQADGGTRTASITGAFVALVEACETIYDGKKPFPVKDFLAAISVGISPEGVPLLDVCYEEDSAGVVDMNVVRTGEGQYVEIQGTGEGRPFSSQELGMTVTLARERFPQRRYDSFTLPAGEYDSLRVTLGAGEGHNWWCVVFPPLCTTAVSAAELSEAMSRDGYAVITESEGYELRFRTLELWGELMEYVFVTKESIFDQKFVKDFQIPQIATPVFSTD